PSLSLHPSEEVALGDTVTLRCRVPRSDVRVSFYKEGHGVPPWHTDEVKDTAEFSVNVTRNSAGRYTCRYEILASPWYSDLSDPVDLVVLDPAYTPPTMSLSPKGRVEPGTDVTISCQSSYGVNFILHKDGSAIQRQQLKRGHTATFILPRVTEDNAGTYGCSYRPRENPFISS
ncbi:Leukocyte immunoglobulin-like receptor subfamily A member 2, partial [Tinamus guttatus]